MNCGRFKKIAGEYANRTLSGPDAENAELHLSKCAECAELAGELRRTSTLVRSLGRSSAPMGFEARLKARIASGKPERIRSAAIGSRVFALRPALAGLILCALLLGSIFMFNPGWRSDVDTDWGYIEVCRDQHSSFAGANPLGDGSAAILRERAHDLGENL